MDILLYSSIIMIVIGLISVYHISFGLVTPLQLIAHDKAGLEKLVSDSVLGIFVGCLMTASGIITLISGISSPWILAAIPLMSWYNWSMAVDFKKIKDDHDSK